MFIDTLENFKLNSSLFVEDEKTTTIESFETKNQTNDTIKTCKYYNEFWTAKQRASNSIHEVSYRGCFKPQLPNFFIKNLTLPGDIIYDPFLGRGTTILEAALLNRQIIGNDINPLSIILSEPRLLIPDIRDLSTKLDNIHFDKNKKADIDISMFYHKDTEGELVSLREYILNKEKTGQLTNTDKWIRMVATNRLTGHSKGFFSVWTMPPNQAVLPNRQIKINQKMQQQPEYRNVRELIKRKTTSLIKNISSQQKQTLKNIHKTACFLNQDASDTKKIKNNSVSLTVTSPPFLDVVQYETDNWLRGWFNGLNTKKIGKNITMAKTIDKWSAVMQNVFDELYRITKKQGYVAFEVGDVKQGKIKLDEYVAPLGLNSGFNLIGIIINTQNFTKTSNLWGVKNNKKGTNSNKIVLFQK
jgi:DNA modification methylase